MKPLIREMNNLVLVQTLIWFSHVEIKLTRLHSWSRTCDKEVEIRLKSVIEIMLTATVSGFLGLIKKVPMQ